MSEYKKPLIVITGSAGDIGSSLMQALGQDYQVVGCDMPGKECDIEIDLTSDPSVTLAIQTLQQRYGNHIAAVVHLAAYFDFSGEDSPLYQSVNVEGTRRLLEALQTCEVERFIYTSTMLVHAPCEPGHTIDEYTPIEPAWAYPESKARAEEAIHFHHGHIPYTILRLAGLYDETSGVPTLVHQIARIYENDLHSHFYAGDLKAGQAFIHKEDLIRLVRHTLERRTSLPAEDAILAGETEVLGYDELQQMIGELIHGKSHWDTFALPETIAKAGAWLEEKAEPIIPDQFDDGETPFIKPFMMELASDHYALDIRRAREQLEWEPTHRIRDALPKMIKALKRDPYAWYQSNGIHPPDWVESAHEQKRNAESLRENYEATYRQEHRQNLWAHFLTIGLGLWLISSPFAMGYAGGAMMWSDLISGALIMVCGGCALSVGKWFRLARFGSAIVSLWVLFAPLVFWTESPAAYLNGSIIGTLTFALALVVRPFPAMSPTAAASGPEIPPGWDFTPSSWFQRLPIIILAFIGFFISRYLTAYQLGHIDQVWEPFFGGFIPHDGKNGTEEIITSSVSQAWPVPDAGLGALVYLLEILTGLIGSSHRWRTMPWLVLLFGFMIVPLGAISITFIIIQPIMLGTWCSLCLIAAAAMLVQIPYSFDEIVATIEFLRRRARQGRPWMKILFTGDTDWEGNLPQREEDNFSQPLPVIIRDVIGGGVSVPWNLGLCAAIGVWLMFTRLTLGTEGSMADADHLIGSLVLTLTVTAFAEVARALRFLNIFLGAALVITPFVYGAGITATLSSLVCGVGLMIFSARRGPVSCRWGEWSKAIF